MIDKLLKYLETLYSVLTKDFEKTVINLSPEKSDINNLPSSAPVHSEEIHYFEEIVFCINGSFSFFIDDVTYTLNKDQVLIIPNNAAHYFYPGTSEKDIYLLWIVCYYDSVQFHTTKYNDGRIIDHIDGPIMVHTVHADYVIEAFNEIKNQATRDYKTAALFLSSFILLLIKKLSRSSVEDVSNSDTGFVKHVKDYITSNLHKKLLLKDISDHVYLSPNYMGYKFKQISGTTVKIS